MLAVVAVGKDESVAATHRNLKMKLLGGSDRCLGGELLPAAFSLPNDGSLLVRGQANALGQIAGGPAVGAIGTLFSLRAALVTAALLLSPALALYAKSLQPTPEVAVSEG